MLQASFRNTYAFRITVLINEQLKFKMNENVEVDDEILKMIENEGLEGMEIAKKVTDTMTSLEGILNVIESNDDEHDEEVYEKHLANANEGPPLQLKFGAIGPNKKKYHGKQGTSMSAKNARIRRIKTLVSKKPF
jgi:hypothetical protein